MTSLSGQVALVTSAREGFGPAIAQALAQAGAIVALHGSDPQRLGLDGEGATRAFGVSADLTDAREAQRMIDEVYHRHQRLDLVVFCQPAGPEAALLALTADEWRAGLDESVNAAFCVVQAAARYMLLERRGRLVLVARGRSPLPHRGRLAEAAAEGALSALTRALALELAPKNIVVNAVVPGLVAPPGETTPPPERVLEAIPLHRLGRPEDVADLVVFLASDEPAYITGEVLALDGGLGGRR